MLPGPDLAPASAIPWLDWAIACLNSLASTEWPPEDTLNEPRESVGQENRVLDASIRAISQRKSRDNAMPELKLVEFSVELPEAQTVQLASDFTDWEENSLDMVRFDRGVWSTTVPLPPGIYAYRFLVDGQWYDDPRAIWRDTQPGDTPKAFVRVK